MQRFSGWLILAEDYSFSQAQHWPLSLALALDKKVSLFLPSWELRTAWRSGQFPLCLLPGGS